LAEVIIIGGGLAGSEAAWQLARCGVTVEIFEMRPYKSTPAHQTDYLAELVCSNSFKAVDITTASGLLKKEMEIFDSLILTCALATKIPAGGALAVERESFSHCVTKRLSHHPLISIKREEIKELPSCRPLIIATGPLTSLNLSISLKEVVGEDYLYFYDATSPIVTAESIDYSKAFLASRYNKGEGFYLNCPLSQKEYDLFYEALIEARTHPLHAFEKEKLFEACLPVEALAKRGKETLRFGPLKPVGLTDPKDGCQPYAVVQLRPEDKEGRLYNLVGFQTNLKWPEQERVFRLIPALKNAEFVRFGVMHRNTYVNAPKVLNNTLELKNEHGLFLAGQITGVEGYLESAATGIVAAINACRLLEGKNPVSFPKETAIGSLLFYLENADAENFQPMHCNFGLFPPLVHRIKNKKERYFAIAERALTTMKNFKLNLLTNNI